MNYSIHIAVFAFVVFCCSCTNEKSFEGMPVNIYADAARTNSYQDYGKFYCNMYIVDSIKTNELSGVNTIPLYLSSKETLVSTTNGYIALIEHTTIKWKFKIDSNETIAANIAADKNKNIYCITNKANLISLSINGKLNWKKSLADSINNNTSFSSILATDDGVVAAMSSGIIAKIDFAGKILWRYYSKLAPAEMFCADSKNSLYIPLTNNAFGETDSLLILASNGKMINKIPFNNTRLMKHPVCYNDVIYLAAVFQENYEKTPMIIAIDANGKTLWKKNIEAIPMFISVSNKGQLFVAGFNSGLGEVSSTIYSFDKTGKQLWELFMDISIPAPIIISKDFAAFLGYQKGEPTFCKISFDGVFDNSISLSEAPLMYSKPAINPIGMVTYFGAEKLCIISLDDTPFNKIF